MRPFNSAVGFERTELSSISGRGPKYRNCKAPNQGPTLSTATASDATPSTAPGMRRPSGAWSRKRACAKAMSASTVSQSSSL